MTLHFSINYQAQWGNQLAVLYAMDADLQTASPLQLPMDCHGSADWSAQVTLSDIHKYISYCYVVLDPHSGYCFCLHIIQKVYVNDK